MSLNINSINSGNFFPTASTTSVNPSVQTTQVQSTVQAETQVNTKNPVQSAIANPAFQAETASSTLARQIAANRIDLGVTLSATAISSIEVLRAQAAIAQASSITNQTNGKINIPQAVQNSAEFIDMSSKTNYNFFDIKNNLGDKTGSNSFTPMKSQNKEQKQTKSLNIVI